MSRVDDQKSASRIKTWVLQGLFALFLVWLGISYAILASDEEGLRASKNMVLLAIDRMEKKIQAQGYVVKDFKETFVSVLSKTIGEGGRASSSGSFFNSVSENYPEVPDSVWRDLSATFNAEIEAMIDSQESQNDRARALRSKLRSPFYLPAKLVGGFPTIRIEDYEQMIVGESAREAQSSGTLEIKNPLESK